MAPDDWARAAWSLSLPKVLLELSPNSPSLSFSLSFPHLFTGHQRSMDSGSSVVCLKFLRCTPFRIPPPFDNPDNAAAVVDAGMNAQPDGQAMGDEHSES